MNLTDMARNLKNSLTLKQNKQGRVLQWLNETYGVQEKESDSDQEKVWTNSFTFQYRSF